MNKMLTKQNISVEIKKEGGTAESQWSHRIQNEKLFVITRLHVLQGNFCTNTKKHDIQWQDNDE